MSQPSPYCVPIVFKKGICKCTDTFRCDTCLWTLLKTERGENCECGSDNHIGQNHSHWCKMYRKEFR